jgi:large subunit ribosomal protein L10
MKKEKQLLLDEVKGQIDQFDSFVIAQYTKLSANALGQLRRSVHDQGGDVHMVKKTILVRAAKDAGVDLSEKELPGHIGVIYGGSDPLETAKLVFKFSKENDNAFSVVGGRFDGKFYKGKDVETLASLPGKDEMRAQLLSVLEAPLSSTLGTMDAILTSLLHCLENKSQKGS